MTSIQGECPDHGEVTGLHSNNVEILAFTDASGAPIKELYGSYRFTCNLGVEPHTVQKMTATPENAGALAIAGCTIIKITPPKDSIHKDLPTLDEERARTEVVMFYGLPDAQIFKKIEE